MSNESSPAGDDYRPRFHERQYIVDKPFQYRLIGTLLCIWAGNTAFFTLVLYFLYDGHITQFYDLVPREGVMPLLSLSSLFVVSTAFVSVFGIVVLAIIAVYLSNQIAGPLWRTKKCLTSVGKGDWGFKLEFRHSDFLRDVPEVFNGMVDDLRRDAVEDLEELKAIEAAADDAEVIARAKRLREKKEARLGLGSDTAEHGEDREPVTVAVH